MKVGSENSDDSINSDSISLLARSRASKIYLHDLVFVIDKDLT